MESTTAQVTECWILTRWDLQGAALENPIAYDATDLADLEGYIENGVPNCGDACNCM